MGLALLVWRLAVKDLRHRPVQALLLFLAIAAGAATLTLGFSLQGATNNPYARTRVATNGPDVVASVFPGSSNAPGPSGSSKAVGPNTPGAAGASSAEARELAPLEHASGVIAFSGPFPVTWTLLRNGRTTGSAEVEGRSTSLSSVDRPKLLQGTWIRPGGVVVEAAFADALDIHVGDRLQLGGILYRVEGTAVTAAMADYPNVCSGSGCFLAGKTNSYNPGLVWASPSDVRRIARTSGTLAYFLNLKLKSPREANTFANHYDANASPTAPLLVSWETIRAGDEQALANVQLVLLTGSLLLALLALASVAVLVGGRMAEQTRRVGLLKAAGGTPRLVAAVLLFEHVFVGLCAAGLGLLGGRVAAPLIEGTDAGLLGAPSAPMVSFTSVALVVAVALAVAIVATIVPEIRAARQSTVAALDDVARPPRRRTGVIRLSAHLPAALLLGARLAARRPRRLLLSVFSVAVTTSGVVAVLILRATSTGWSLGFQVARATTMISIMLIVLAAINAIFIAWTTALESRHPAALARALGATPKQITVGLATAFLPSALVGALLGIPGGIGIYDTAKSGGTTTLPSAISLVMVVVLTLLIITALTAIPTRIGARRSVAEVLQSETA